MFAGDVFDVLSLAMEANGVSEPDRSAEEAIEALGLPVATATALDVLVALRAGKIRSAAEVSPDDRPHKLEDGPKEYERLEFEKYLEIALGGLDWTGPQFWEATHVEFAAALNGKQSKGRKQSEPLRGDAYDQLKRDALDHKDEGVSRALQEGRSIRSVEDRKAERSFMRKKSAERG